MGLCAGSKKPPEGGLLEANRGGHLAAAASFSHFLMKLFLAAPARALPFLSTALAAQAAAAPSAPAPFSHFLMKLALAAPASFLAAESASHCFLASASHFFIWLVSAAPASFLSAESLLQVANALEQVTDYWSPRIVGQVNDQYIKVAKHKAEDSKISIRNIRRHAKDALDRLQKDGRLSNAELARRVNLSPPATHARLRRLVRNMIYVGIVAHLIDMDLNEVEKALQKQLGKHKEMVFTFRGEPVTATTTKAWYAAVKRAGVHPLRFHDLRDQIVTRRAAALAPSGVAPPSSKKTA